MHILRSPFTVSIISFQFQGWTYQFTCLTFGLSSAPCIFTKVLKPVTGLLRKMSIRITVDLDDMRIMIRTIEGARKDILILKSILENLLGFLINMKNPYSFHVQGIKFLGIIMDPTNILNRCFFSQTRKLL